MPSCSVYITKRQYETLLLIARAKNTTWQKLVRDAIDEYLEKVRAASN